MHEMRNTEDLRMAFKPVGDVLRGRRDEVISARLLNGHSGPQAGGTEAVRFLRQVGQEHAVRSWRKPPGCWHIKQIAETQENNA